jgi:uncharacterized membrane protein
MSKLLAGIGSILLFLGFFIVVSFTSFLSVDNFSISLSIGSILSITGLIFVLIGMKSLAEHYKEDKICKKLKNLKITRKKSFTYSEKFLAKR